jgi:DNA invertase Pin-like site-specific DNA recombinase
MSLINAYVRVSSQEQGDSKLGIDAQIKAIKDYALTTGEEIKEIYIDVKSGKDTNRPELQKCIEMSIKDNAKMVVAKSCRLSRDIADGFNIRKMKLNLVILDTDVKNIMDYGFRMMFNQHEREQISIRTKLALYQLKQRGIKLGKPENFTNESRAKGREVISRNAKENPQNKQATILIKNVQRC